MTYRVDGEQYLAVIAVGASGSEVAGEEARTAHILAFKLGGGAVPQSLMNGAGAKPPPVPETGTPEQIARGENLFAGHCSVCHSSASRAPDLSRLNAGGHREFFDIVLKGSRCTKAMPNFGSTLSEDDATALHAYVTDLLGETITLSGNSLASAD